MPHLRLALTHLVRGSFLHVVSALVVAYVLSVLIFARLVCGWSLGCMV